MASMTSYWPSLVPGVRGMASYSVGTRRFNSSNQFRMRMNSVESPPALSLIIRKRLPSGEMS